MGHWKIITLLVVGLAFSGSPVFALLQKSEDAKIWDHYLDTKKDFEKNVHDLVITKWPKEKHIAQNHLKLELARLDQKDLQFEYVRKRYPDRIDRTQGLSDYAAFDWSKEDESALAGSNAKYAAKSKEVAHLQHDYESMKGRSEFEKNLDNVKSSVEYRSLEDRFKDMVAKLETSWKKFKTEVKK